MLETRPKRVLFIGSGPFPLSAIWLNRILGVSVDGIDVAPAAVRESSSLMASLGLENVIGLRHEPERSYDVSDYDLIVIALLAKPKEQILENIHRTARKDCTVSSRSSNLEMPPRPLQCLEPCASSSAQSAFLPSLTSTRPRTSRVVSVKRQPDPSATRAQSGHFRPHAAPRPTVSFPHKRRPAQE